MEHGEADEPTKVLNGDVDGGAPERDGVESTHAESDEHEHLNVLSDSPRTMSEINGKHDGTNATLDSRNHESVSDSEKEHDVNGNHAESEAGSESGEDESAEEEEEDDEDYEPALKYELLGGTTDTLLEKDSASALAVSPKYLVSCTLYSISLL